MTGDTASEHEHRLLSAYMYVFAALVLDQIS